MDRRRVFVVVVAAVASFAVGLGGAWIGRAATAGTEDTASTTTTTLPVWVRGTEIVVGPVAVIPEQVAVTGSDVAVQFTTHPIGPTEPDPPVGVVPASWTLLTTRGEVGSEGASNLGSVRFVLPVGTSAADITGLRLDTYWIASVLQTQITLSPDDTAPHEIAPGVTVALVTVQAQGTGALVVAETATRTIGSVATASTNGLGADLAITGVGPGWGNTSSNFGNRSRWTLNYYGDAIPDPITLQITGVFWLPLTSGAITPLEGVPHV